jgi:TolB-like protein
MGDRLLYRFDEFVLDAGRRELRRGNSLVAVEPQAFDVIEYLIRNRDRVISKDELLAGVWKGRIVSESALSTCINAARTAIGDNGNTQRLIRTLPRRGLRFVADVDRPASSSDARATERQAPVSPPRTPGERNDEDNHPALTAPDRPSIAVLPFANMSDDREQEYFADGIADDIITALSRFRSFMVIARNSSFTYKNRVVDVKQVGRELGVRYILEGSVRRALNRVRITGQLVDAETGTHLWANRFDGALEDIFDLQDQVMSSVVGAVAPTLVKAEIDRAKRKPTSSLDAYDLYLRGLGLAAGIAPRENEEALRLFSKAIDLDPHFATAYGMAAWCHVSSHVNGWTANPALEIPSITLLARRAADYGTDDAVALAYGGIAIARIIGDLHAGMALIDRALFLNPNLAAAWIFSGWAKAFLGETEAAIEHLERAARLSPLDPLIFLTQMVTSLAHFVAGRYEEASLWAAKAHREKPNFLGIVRLVAVSNALTGRMDEARRALGLARELDPGMRIANLKYRVGPFRAEDFGKYEEGLRLAGLSS